MKELVFDGMGCKKTEDGWHYYWEGSEIGRPDKKEIAMLDEIVALREKVAEFQRLKDMTSLKVHAWPVEQQPDMEPGTFVIEPIDNT